MQLPPAWSPLSDRGPPLACQHPAIQNEPRVVGCRDQGLWPCSGSLKQHMQRQTGDLPPLQPPAAPVAPPSPVHRPAKLMKKEEPHSAPVAPAAVIGRPMQPGGPPALAPQAPRAVGLQLGQFMASPALPRCCCPCTVLSVRQGIA